MSWARLDDRGAFHHKVIRAGNTAYGVWCRCLQMCALNDTCGFVPRELALAIAGPDQTSIDRLTEVRLWVPVRAGESFRVTARKDTGRRDLPDVDVSMSGDGFFIKDFLHFNRTDSDSRSPVREPQDEDAQEVRAQVSHVSTEGRAVDARAPSAHPDAQQTRARKVQPPTRPVPSTRPDPESTPTPSRAREDALASVGGRSSNEQIPETRAQNLREGSAQDARAESAQQPEPASDVERAVIDRLRELGWRSKMLGSRFRGGWEALALRIVREQALTLEAIERLVGVARAKATKGDPMQLVGAWVNPEGATWKGVLADEDMRARHAEARQRGRAAQIVAGRDVHRRPATDEPAPIGDIGPVFGEQA